MEISAEVKEYSNSDHAPSKREKQPVVEVVELPTPSAPFESGIYNLADFQAGNEKDLQVKRSEVQRRKPVSKNAAREDTGLTDFPMSWKETKRYYLEHYNFDVLDISTKKFLNAVYADGFQKGFFFSEEEIEKLRVEEEPQEHVLLLSNKKWHNGLKASGFDRSKFGYSCLLKDNLHDGFMAPDTGLDDGIDLALFFERNNKRPSIIIEVSVSGHASSQIDISKYIFPFGKIVYTGKERLEYDEGKFKCLDDIYDDYVKSTNKMKCIQLKKIVEYDFETLKMLIKNFVAQQYGCLPRQVHCNIQTKEKSIRLYTDSSSNKVWETIWGRALTSAAIIPGIAMSIYAEEARW
eukprot:CAMPEP_0184017444 /NCGR_PEP_ID=MMETSP0954-20121128/7538_1 /TAXON_ID=627963 /ORGANISM="Aplanochytrium sp, Strain PBS07" /LENGTH=349 /DNA_ID=CAMNT_0026298677 /DNA_START=229 /DNA_END=1275 /DNA_ORIENTATION=+